jgi:hypothetical protein
MKLILPYFYHTKFNFLTLKTNSTYSTVALIQGPNSVLRLVFTFACIIKNDLIRKKLSHVTSLTVFLSNKVSEQKLHLLKSVLKLATSYFCYMNYRGLKVKGIGYKFVSTSLNTKHYLFLIVGLSHLVIHRFCRTTTFMKLKKKKRLLILNSINYEKLANECRMIRNLSVPNVYSGKGLHFYHHKITLKQGKKQSR